MSIPLRPFGRTGVKVSALALGAMMFGQRGNSDHDDSIRVIHRALDAGINLIDTADVYSQGESETIVGKALKGRRDEVFLATKFHGQIGTDPNQFGNSRRWIAREIDNSLRRLQTDHVDLYQVHRPEEDTDFDETLGALSDLVHQGKIRYIGTSTFEPSAIVEGQWIAEKRGRERVVSEQPPYSLLARGRGAGGTADRAEVRPGGDSVEPAGRRLADRQVPQGRPAAGHQPRRPPAGTLRDRRAGERREARGGRGPGRSSPSRPASR